MFMSVFNVKVRVLYCDWLICEIILAACEYNNNTKGERKTKTVIWNSKAKGFSTEGHLVYSIKKINEKNTKNRLKNYNPGSEINFFSDSHLAPKFFKVVAKWKKVSRHFQRQTKPFFKLSAL